jgi:hypothetical protein
LKHTFVLIVFIFRPVTVFFHPAVVLFEQLH